MRQVIAQILLELNGGALSIDGIPYPVESRILPDGNSGFLATRETIFEGDDSKPYL